jgi:integrase
MATVVKRRGKWCVDFRDQLGKRHFKFFETRKEADAHLSTVVKDVQTGRYRSPAELPTFAEVAARWLEGKRDHPATTFANYQTKVEQHLVPAFGPLRIDRVTPHLIEDFRNAKWQGGEGLARSTVNTLLERLGAVLDYALAHDYVTRNAARLVKRVRRERKAGQVGERAVDPKEVLSAEQAGRLVAAAAPGLVRTFLQTALLTGCRSGELLGLAWDAVDFERRKLRIARSLSWARGAEKGYGKSAPVFGPPKSDSSYRTLDLAPELLHALKRWKLQAPPSELVFPNQTGRPLHRAYLHKGLKRALDACPDLPRVDLHGLRHSFASICIGQLRLPPTQVAKLLGHKDASITLAVYSHWFEGLSSEGAMGALAAAICAPKVFPNGDQMVTSAVTAPATS